MTVTTPLDLRFTPGAPPVLAADPADARWVVDRTGALRAAAAEHGAVVVRGLPWSDRAAFAALARALCGDRLMTETEAFAPRVVHPEGVHGSTPWPAHEAMCLHHELSYVGAPPTLLVFGCVTSPATGGDTPVPDAREVLAALPSDLVGRFAREGWRLDRCYHPAIGASWAAAFGTDDPAVVEARCRATGTEFTWSPDGTLRTRQRRPAAVRHPATGRACWTNQVAFLSEWTMDPDVREFLVDDYGEDSLPFVTRFGDGGPVGRDVVDTVNAVYAATSRSTPWRAGDLLVVDNVAAAHGRESFTGPRELLVALGVPTILEGAR